MRPSKVKPDLQGYSLSKITLLSSFHCYLSLVVEVLRLLVTSAIIEVSLEKYHGKYC